MKMNQLYKPKSLNKEEIYRNFISIYYYLLFNEKSNNYYKKIIKYFYKERTDEFQNFFYNNFLKNQNILIFTLYNQLPIEFLPFPKMYLYLNFPLITFLSNFNKYEQKNYYKYEQIKLNSNYINYKKVFDIDLYWEEFNMTEITLNEVKKIKETIPEIKNESETSIYDDFQICFNINYFTILPNNFLNNKIIILFTNEPIISNKFKIIKDKKLFILYEYYVKNKKLDYEYKIEKKFIQLKHIKFISVYSRINEKDLLNCFTKNVLPKNTYLYNQIVDINSNDLDTSIPNWFTLTPFSRIQDPLYLIPSEKYKHREFITNEDIHMLNLSSNIYLNNILINKNYLDSNNLLYCFNNYSKLKYCNYEFINGNKLNTQFNYNKKLALLIIIWKNKKFVDRTISFIKFLILFNQNSFFNIMSFIRLNNNEIKQISEELYIKSANISLINDYTDDIKKFNLYNQKEKYDKIYYSKSFVPV